MRSSILGRKGVSPGSPPTGLPIDDILHLIIEGIYLDDEQETLLSICLVSRRFYVLTVPFLYRNVKLDFSRPSHAQLVQRLAKPGSRLARRIRVLGIAGTEKAAALRLLDLYRVLFTRITNLQQLDWKGCLDIPQPILQALSVRFPTARLNLDATTARLGGPTRSPLPLPKLIGHVACRQLTHFDFKPIGISQLYEGIKPDLMHMLKQNEALQFFRWVEKFRPMPAHPEMVDYFRRHRLSRIKKLHLYSYTLFTNTELRLWGQQGGWSELTELSLYKSCHLCAFFGKIPRLQKLAFHPTKRNSLETIGVCLQNRSFDVAFSNTRIFSYKDPTRRSSLPRQSQVVPWCMLERMPRLQVLHIDRYYFVSECPGPVLNMPTVQDLSRIRTMFPRLEVLSLDISIAGFSAKWPYDVLEELASFDGYIELNMFLHTRDAKITRAMLNRAEFSRIFRHIVARRKSKQLPCRWPFKVGFKVVRLWKEYRNQSEYVDWHMWLDNNGHTKWTRYCIRDEDEHRDEHATSAVQRVSQWLGWDREGPNNQSARPTTGIDLDSTLWDAWTA
jgi:hypothetical protein